MATEALEQLKEADKKIKMQSIAKQLPDLKALAKETYASKFALVARLKKMGLSDKEQKSVIDWLNSLDEVQLTSEEEQEITDEQGGAATKVAKDSEKNFNPMTMTTSTSGYLSTSGASHMTTYRAQPSINTLANPAVYVSGTTLLGAVTDTSLTFTGSDLLSGLHL
jgi:Zn-dependent peptidase ImmA (M78 family)